MGKTVSFSGLVVLGRPQGGGCLSCWWGASMWRWRRKARGNERAEVVDKPGKEWDRGLVRDAPSWPRPGEMSSATGSSVTGMQLKAKWGQVTLPQWGRNSLEKKINYKGRRRKNGFQLSMLSFPTNHYRWWIGAIKANIQFFQFTWKEGHNILLRGRNSRLPNTVYNRISFLQYYLYA